MFESFKNFFNTYISMESIFDIVSIIVPLYLTYRITKYSLSNPRKISINEQQFKNVYLPLYKLVSKIDISSLSKSEALRFSKRMYSITQKNYELTFPQLHSLLEELVQQINKDKNYQSTFNKIKHQVSLDYEILKKKLGYPSITSIEIFKRKTLKEKLLVIAGWINVAIIISPLFVPYFLPGKNFLFLILIYLASFIFMVFISILINSMKD